MARTIEARYENGVFKPLEPITLAEGQVVEICLPEEPDDRTAEEIEEEMRKTHEIFGALSDEEWNEIAKSWRRGS
jgi:predicted DNA-binding antitoxin AbrB/MazE fold protein